MIYINNDLSALCDLDQTLLNGNADSPLDLLPLPLLPQPSQQQQQQLATSQQQQQQQPQLGARCLKLSPNCAHLATGDRKGNIRIYDLQTFDSICLIEAHDGEILYLQYSQPLVSSLSSSSSSSSSSKVFLVSSSRDRLVHIFDATDSTYNLVQVLDDHSASISAVRFFYDAFDNQFSVVSCGFDKSIMFRTWTKLSSLTTTTTTTTTTTSTTTTSTTSSQPQTPLGPPPLPLPPQQQQQQGLEMDGCQFVRTSFVAEKQTFHDLHIDQTKNLVYAIAQDRVIRVYNVKDGKKVKHFKGSLNEDGYLIKMDINSTGTTLINNLYSNSIYS